MHVHLRVDLAVNKVRQNLGIQGSNTTREWFVPYTWAFGEKS